MNINKKFKLNNKGININKMQTKKRKIKKN